MKKLVSLLVFLFIPGIPPALAFKNGDKLTIARFQNEKGCRLEVGGTIEIIKSKKIGGPLATDNMMRVVRYTAPSASLHGCASGKRVLDDQQLRHFAADARALGKPVVGDTVETSGEPTGIFRQQFLPNHVQVEGGGAECGLANAVLELKKVSGEELVAEVKKNDDYGYVKGLRCRTGQRVQFSRDAYAKIYDSLSEPSAEEYRWHGDSAGSADPLPSIIPSSAARVDSAQESASQAEAAGESAPQKQNPTAGTLNPPAPPEDEKVESGTAELQ